MWETSCNKAVLLAPTPHSQLTFLLRNSGNKPGTNSCSSVLRLTSSNLSKAWQELPWDGGSPHCDVGVVPSLSFPATLGHGLPGILLTGGTSPGESAPTPGAASRSLQQDMHHFTPRLHLTPHPVVKIMDVALLYLCSSPNIVINPIYYTNAFAWHIDFVVLETKNFTGDEKEGIHNARPHPPPPIANSGEKNYYLLKSMLEQFTKAECLFIQLAKTNITVDCAEV